MMVFYYVWFSILSFVLGSVMGSAMTCLGDRLAEGKSWVKGRSQCDACGHVLNGLDLIPVFSYIKNHGRCRYCGAKLSKKYLFSEIGMGALFLIIFLQREMIDAKVILLWGMSCAVSALSVTDLDCYIIPDRLIVFLIAWRAFFWIFDHSTIKDDLAGGVVIGGFVLIIVLIMDKILKKETMGGGDIKLLFALGLYTGLAGGMFMLILACIIGLLFMIVLKRNKMPFGPSISLAAVLVLLFGNGLINWYLGLLGI